MTKLTITYNYNIILKRFMETQTEQPKSPKPAVQEEIIVEENAPLLSISTPLSPIPSSSWSQKLRDTLFTSSKKDNPEITSQTNTIGNETTEPFQFSGELATPVVPYKFYTKEAERTDSILRGIVTNLTVCGDRLNMEIEKLENLRIQWQESIAKSDKLMDDFNQVTQSFWKKKWFTVSVSTITIAFFLFQMYKYKALPNFVGLVIDAGSSIFTSATKDNVPDIATMPKPSLQNTIKVIAETPLAPLTILTGVGLFTISLGALRFATFILKKMPK